MLQVIYQYASIVTGVNVHYPEPAKTIIRVVSVFSLQVLNYAPPECVNEGASFYDRLLADVYSSRRGSNFKVTNPGEAARDGSV